MMKNYEMVREIFNKCSGNQMRDVFFEEVATDDPEEVVKSYLVGNIITCERGDFADGSIIFDVNTDGIPQRFTFSEI